MTSPFRLALLYAAALLALQAAAWSRAEGATVEPAGRLYGPVPLDRVIDGDTIVVSSNVGPRTVRLIGIDAPELSGGDPGGAEAHEELAALLGAGERLWLEVDLDLEDVYGRLLGYVYYPDPAGGWEIAGERVTQANLAMLERGWARLLTIGANITYVDLYESAVGTAVRDGLGLWSPSLGRPAAMDTATRASGPVRLHCALVNPVAQYDVGEWVTVMLDEPFDTRGYYLYDEGSSSTFRLPSGVQPAGEIKIENPGQGVWNNGGDTIFLMRAGEVVESWTYTKREAVEGAVICRDGAE